MSELESEAIRQARTVRRRKWAAITGLAFLVVAALVAVGLAVQKAGEARTQARAGMLATEAALVLANADARTLLSTRRLHAALLGVESLREDPTPQGTELVHRALSGMPVPIRTFDAYEGSHIGLSDDGRVLAATLPSGDITVWEVSTGRALLHMSDRAHPSPEIALSGDGRLLARDRPGPGDRSAVVVTDVASGRVLRSFEVPLPPLSLALSHNGGRLAVADREYIRLFDPRRGVLLRTVAAQRGNVYTGGLARHLAFTESGEDLTVLWRGVVQTLHTKRGDGQGTVHAVAQLESNDRLVAAVSGDGRRVATGDGTGTIQVWDTETLTEISRVEHGASYVQAVVLSTSGAWLAGVSRHGKLTVWRLQDGTLPVAMSILPGWKDDLDHHVTLTGDGEGRVLVSSDTAIIERIGEDSPTLRLRVAGGSSAVAANRDGASIAVTDAFEFTRLYNTRSGQEITRVPTPAEDYGGMVEALALSGDGSRMAAGGDFEIVQVLDVSTGKVLLRLRGTPGPADRHAVFALDDSGQRLAVAAAEGALTVLSLDGTRLPLTRDLPSPVSRVAFSRDGQFILIDCLDRTLRVLDASTLQEQARIPHQFYIAALAFAAGGTQVRVVLHDGSVRQSVWRPRDLIDQACSVIGRNFSRAEWPRYFPDEPFRLTCDNPGPRH